MSIGLIALIIFVALVLICGLFLAWVDRAPMGWQDRAGWHEGEAPPHITQEELDEWN